MNNDGSLPWGDLLYHRNESATVTEEGKLLHFSQPQRWMSLEALLSCLPVLFTAPALQCRISSLQKSTLAPTAHPPWIKDEALWQGIKETKALLRRANTSQGLRAVDPTAMTYAACLDATDSSLLAVKRLSNWFAYFCILWIICFDSGGLVRSRSAW